jgi:methylenetetrahydrofolate dehydrogenase (NADP+)/methenyltetrahydrofolate cyclohydrolase
MRKLLAGAPVAEAMSERLLKETAQLRVAGVFPKLAIVRVGERPDDLSYERAILKRMSKLGIDVEVVALPEDVSQDDVEARLAQANEDPATHGILVFRPLPEHLDEARIRRAIDPSKDVDGMSPQNEGLLFEGDERAFAPCTAQAVVEMFDHYRGGLRGRRVVVLGRSMVVGRPVAMLLLARDATVTICHSKTKDLADRCREADILVCAIGRARYVTADMVSPDAVVIDVGINVDASGELVGDVDYEAVSELAASITPVPGGVGSVTTSVLADHVIRAARAIG